MEKIGGSAKIKKIAVVGIISAGKSTVCELLKAQGAYVLNADDIVHDLLSQDVITIQKIKEVFGKGVISQGQVDRKALANQVFTHSELLKSLEAILHPKVVKTIQDTYSLIEHRSDYKAFVVEFPLLFEIQFDTWFDEIIFVTADINLCKKRFLQRGFSEEQFEKRIKRFAHAEDKITKSHYVITNNGSVENLKKQIENIL